MPKYATRKNKLIKKKYRNKSIKYSHRGGAESTLGGVLQEHAAETTSALGRMADDAKTYVVDTSLDYMGLQKKRANDADANVDVDVDELSTPPGVLQTISEDVKKAANGITAAAITNVNEFLENPQTNGSAMDAVNKTADILGDFNQTASNPETVKAVDESLNIMGNYADMTIQAAKDPIKDATKVITEAGIDATSAAASGLMRVGTDLLAAVPGVGGILDIGKAINDGSRALKEATVATREITGAVSTAASSFKENLNQSMDALKQTQAQGDAIANRANESIDRFTHPTLPTLPMPQQQYPAQQYPRASAIRRGGGRTRHKLSKRKLKTKRVRFNV